MEATLKQLNIDKSSWVPVKFGDIAKEPKENAKDMQAEGIEHVVGLEHIDSEDVHLRRSANLQESTTFTKKFAKGDVLFGRRRAYLKKAAQASFSGICSGDITVFRAKDGILPELLPFVVCNDKFFDYAVKHSAGGLSPRVKFKDLANYQFLLPPKDQQKQLAEVLWAMDDVIEKEREVLNQLEVTIELSLGKLFNDNTADNFIKIKELYSKKFKSVHPSVFQTQLIYHYSLPSYLENRAPEITTADNIKSNKLLIDRDTILFSKLNPNKPKIWKVSAEKDKVILGSTEWLPVLPSSELSSEYLEAYFTSRVFLDKVMKFVQGSSNSHKRIDPKRFYDLKIPVLENTITERIENTNKQFKKNRKNVEAKVSSSQALQKKIINEIF